MIADTLAKNAKANAPKRVRSTWSARHPAPPAICGGASSASLGGPRARPRC